MSENVFGSAKSPGLLSPNLRVKAQKRRRTRLATGDVDLERSTQELLTALRDPVVCQNSTLKPLPGISAVDRAPANGLFDSHSSEAVKEMELTNQSRRMEKQRGSRRKRFDELERCPTFTKSQSAADEDPREVVGQSKAKARENVKVSNRPKLGDDTSIFSDISDELGFERRTRRRNSRRALCNRQSKLEDTGASKDIFLDTEQTPTVSNASPRRRISRRGRNSPAVVSPIEKLTLRDGCSPKARVRQRSLAFDGILDGRESKLSTKTTQENIKHHQEAEQPGRQSKLQPIGDGLELTKSNLKTHDTEHDVTRPRKPRRRQGRNQTDVFEKPPDHAASDIMSTVSGDATEAYDPTFSGATRPEVNSRLLAGLRNANLEKVKAAAFPQHNHASGHDQQTSGDDVSVDIFTSPKRHKKRSRRRHQQQVENFDLMQQDSQLKNDVRSSSQYLASGGTETVTKSECVFGSIGNDLGGKPNFGTGHNVSPRRRAYNKYLPPLSESLNHLK